MPRRSDTTRPSTARPPGVSPRRRPSPAVAGAARRRRVGATSACPTSGCIPHPAQCRVLHPVTTSRARALHLLPRPGLRPAATPLRLASTSGGAPAVSRPAIGEGARVSPKGPPSAAVTRHIIAVGAIGPEATRGVAQPAGRREPASLNCEAHRRSAQPVCRAPRPQGCGTDAPQGATPCRGQLAARGSITPRGIASAEDARQAFTLRGTRAAQCRLSEGCARRR